MSLTGNKEVEEYHARQLAQKASPIGYDRLVEAVKMAVDFFGEGTVLDVGFGTIDNLKIWRKEKFWDFVVTGFDLRHDFPASSESVLQGDMHDMKEVEDQSYDHVFCSHTLEHAMDYLQVMREIMRVAKKKIMIVVPIETPEQVRNDPHHEVVVETEQVVMSFIGGYWKISFEYRYAPGKELIVQAERYVP